MIMMLEKLFLTVDDNWSDDWKEWLKLLKIECLLALGENGKFCIE